MHTIRIATELDPKWLNSVRGKRLDDRHYTRVIGDQDVNVVDGRGVTVLALRKAAVCSEVALDAYPHLLPAVTLTHTRPDAQGDAKELWSGTVGYTHKTPRKYTRTRPDSWERLLPLFAGMDAAFRRELPDQYRKLVEADVDPGCRIPGTPFTTGTVNYWDRHHNARMGAHHDKGNLPGSMGVMTVIRGGEYKGGLLVFPRYRVAVDLGSCDLLIADNTELHGNTAVESNGEWSRVSVVAFVHASNLRDGRGSRQVAKSSPPSGCAPRCSAGGSEAR